MDWLPLPPGKGPSSFRKPRYVLDLTQLELCQAAVSLEVRFTNAQGLIYFEACATIMQLGGYSGPEYSGMIRNSRNQNIWNRPLFSGRSTQGGGCLGAQAQLFRFWAKIPTPEGGG